MTAMKPKRRILFINYTAGICGPTNSLWMLLRYLRERYDPAVLLPETGDLCQILSEESVPYYILPGLGINTIPAIHHLIRHTTIDLVYGNSPHNCSRNGMIAARLAGRPFIWHFRGVKRSWGWTRGFYLRGASAIIAVSNAAAEPLKRFYPAERIHVVYNGVDFSQLDRASRSQSRVDLLHELGLPQEAHLLLSVAHLTPRKAHEKAIETMASLVRHSPSTHLLVAGAMDRDPSYTEKILFSIKYYRLEDHIHLLGLRTDIPRLLSSADGFLHVASWEAHPRAVIEAMAAGLPVVAFDVNGVNETIIDGQTGYLAPPGDIAALVQALQKLMGSPSLGQELGANGQRYARQHFSAARTAEQVAAIIDGVLGSRER